MRQPWPGRREPKHFPKAGLPACPVSPWCQSDKLDATQIRHGPKTAYTSFCKKDAAMHLLTKSLTLALLCTFALPLRAADVEGSSDYPGIGRYEGSQITGYKISDFDTFNLLEAKGSEGFRTLEGAVTRIAYMLPESATIVAAERSFAQALEAAGFDITFSCATDDCGGVSYDLDQLPIPLMGVDRFDYRVLTGKGAAEGADLHAQVIVSQDGNRRVRVQLNVVRTEAFTSRMIDAAQMQSEISQTGRVALYGIYFDTDSAALKPASDATVAEIAKLLAGGADLNVIIVGHTDNQGGLEYNLDLSQARAKSVHDALASAHGITPDRMQFAGVGFLAPVATNATSEGRALNRRVEIVAQ